MEDFEAKANYALHCSVYFHREPKCHNKTKFAESKVLFNSVPLLTSFLNAQISLTCLFINLFMMENTFHNSLDISVQVSVIRNRQRKL